MSWPCVRYHSPVSSASESASSSGSGPLEGVGEGTVLSDRYRLVRELGAGGMGSVWEAEHCQIGNRVAIKVLTRDVGADSMGERFLREARAASIIRHEHVVEIMDFGETPGGGAYYAMEFLEGEDLGVLLARDGRLPWARVKHLSRQILAALQASHDAGVVHRDLKPSNCFRITRAGDTDYIKLIDFGIAKTLGADVSTLTDVGTVIGTVQYMSPEQATGRDIDGRADVYSFAAMMFQMLTGTYPYEAPTAMGILTRHVTDPIPSLRKRCPDADIPPAVDRAVQKGLAKDPGDRWASADAFLEALLKIPAEQWPVGGVRTGTETMDIPAVNGGGLSPARIGLAVGVLALLGAGGYLLSRGQGEPPAAASVASPAATKAPDPSPAPPAPEPQPEPAAAAPEGTTEKDPEPPIAEEPAPAEAEGPAPAETEPAPESATATTTRDPPARRSKRAVEKKIKSKIRSCKPAGGGTAKVPVKVKVSGSGKPTSVSATYPKDPALEKCIISATKGLNFGEGKAGESFDFKLPV